MDGKKLFGMLPGYLTDGIGETYHMDVLSALKEIYPDKTLCSIIYYLNSSEFIEMKKNTDKFIEKHGLKKAVEESLKENSNLIPVSLFDTREVTNMSGIFKNNNSFNEPLNLWNTRAVTDMSFMFCDSVFNKPLNLWNTRAVTDMSFMFIYSKFNKPLESWNVCNVKDMSFMIDDSDFCLWVR